MKTLPTLAAAAAALLLALPALAQDPTSPLAAGKKLYDATCGTCHEIERSLAKKADRAAWEATVKQMIANGARLDEAGGSLVVGYLAAKSAFELRCNVCHDLERPLKAIKNPQQWRDTVTRMAAMTPGAISEADAGAITLYLSLVGPPPQPAQP